MGHLPGLNPQFLLWIQGVPVSQARDLSSLSMWTPKDLPLSRIQQGQRKRQECPGLVLNCGECSCSSSQGNLKSQSLCGLHFWLSSHNQHIAPETFSALLVIPGLPSAACTAFSIKLCTIADFCYLFCISNPEYAILLPRSGPQQLPISHCLLQCPASGTKESPASPQEAAGMQTRGPAWSTHQALPTSQTRSYR